MRGGGENAFMPSAATPKTVGFGTRMWWAVRMRCPRCGSRRTFIRRWLGKYERCRTCGIPWRREEGFELGPLALNTVITFFTLAVAMAVGFVITYPDVPVVPMILWCAGIALLLPLIAYPFTFLIWLAFDLAVHPPEAKELSDAAAAVAHGSPDAPPE
jgi:uncharacterized protein (DUF983 family)